ncbi:hypothetical protein FRC07_002092 [Ceratobasidium sp. 392]|nr:hypothetical protein FRC07_002092 [Ceratobasidium sp. 392]
MASSTLTLPFDALSAAHSSPFRSYPNETEAKHSTSPVPSDVIRRTQDQEAIEMDVLGSRRTDSTLTVTSAPLEIPAWNLSLKKEWTAIAACCLCMFLGGWNDATTGPLLPNFQELYHVNFTVVSMLFVCSCAGFISAAVFNVFMTDRFGFGKVILLGALVQVVGYTILAPAPPFPVMCLAYAFNGFGIALQNAQSNGLISALPNNTSAKMGLLHAGYGVGAFLAPLVATQFSQLPRWSFHYLTSLALALINTGVLFATFRLKEQNDVLGVHTPPLDLAASANVSGDNKYKQIISSRGVQLTAFFVWVYVGAEVTTGGWIVTFVIEERGGGSSAGGFFAGMSLITHIIVIINVVLVGLTIGRVALLWVNEKIGERRVIYLYSVLAIGLEMIIWFVPNIIGNAVAVALVELLLGYVGPFYPIAMNITGRTVPKWILIGSIGWIASLGQAGSAVFPFLTGALAQKVGQKAALVDMSDF